MFLWNAFSFFTTYAAADGLGAPIRAAPPPATRPRSTAGSCSVLQSLIARVNREMEGYLLRRGFPLIAFVDDLTNWYIRRSRRRFWRRPRCRQRGHGGRHPCRRPCHPLRGPGRLRQGHGLVLPFVTETLYQHLVVEQTDPGAGSGQRPSLRLPRGRPHLIDPALEADMAVHARVVGLGHGLSVEPTPSGPPAAAVSDGGQPRPTVPATMISESSSPKSSTSRQWPPATTSSHAHLSAKPNYRRLGPRLGAPEGAGGGDRGPQQGHGRRPPGRRRTRPVGGGDRPRRGGGTHPHPGVVVPRPSAGRGYHRHPGTGPRTWPRWSKRFRPGGALPGLEVTNRITLTWASDDQAATEAMAEHAAAAGSPRSAGAGSGAGHRRRGRAGEHGHPVWLAVARR